MADVNYQGPFGNTLLHGAAISGNAREVKRLLAAGADPGIRNREGRTPLEITEAPRVRALLSAASLSASEGSSGVD